MVSPVREPGCGEGTSPYYYRHEGRETFDGTSVDKITCSVDVENESTDWTLWGADDGSIVKLINDGEEGAEVFLDLVVLMLIPPLAGEHVPGWDL